MKVFTRTDAQTTKKTLSIFRQELRYEKKSFLLGIILVPVSNFLYIVLIPLLISFVIQALVNQSDNVHIWWLMGGIGIVSILAIITNQIGFKEIFEHEERIVTRLIDRSMSSLMNHSQSFFSNRKVGSLANDVNTFSRSYMTFMDTITMQLMGIAVSYIASLVVIAFIAPILLLPLSLITWFVVWHSMRSMAVRAPYRNKRKELQSQLIGTIADVIGNQVLVRLFGKKDAEIDHILNERADIERLTIKEVQMIQANAKVRQAVLFGFQFLTVVLIVVLYENGQLEIGPAIFVITYLARITSTMFNLTSIIRGVEQSLLDAAKITEILDISPEVKDDTNAEDLIVNAGQIRFDNVGFAYQDAKDEYVFENLNLTIEPKTRVGLVGKSGGGKTTLTSLLLRYSDVSTGRIQIDKQNIDDIKQDSLRAAISYVPQDPYLFHRSLRENIAYGKPGASDDQIIDAAKKAHAMEFIDKLPARLDTVVGERGVKLSGGQRQRIAIARAILKDAPILVLDEATSALDSESEKLIQASLDELMKDRTSIIIAHRLSTIAKLDRIIVLDNGKIVEDGSHSDLLAQNGMYAKFWSHQSGGFIEE